MIELHRFCSRPLHRLVFRCQHFVVPLPHCPIAPLPKVAVAANFGVCEPRVGWNNLRMNLRRCRDLLRPVLVAKSPVMPDFPTFRDVSRCFKVGHANVLTSLSCAKALILTFLGAAYHAYGYVQLRNAQKQAILWAGNASSHYLSFLSTFCYSCYMLHSVVTCYHEIPSEFQRMSPTEVS